MPAIRSGSGPAAALGVGAVAAVVGAAVWAVLVEVTHYKLGFAAVGLGVLVGLAMARTGAGWRPLPAAAAAIALFGCLLGDVLVDASVLGHAFDVGFLDALDHMVTSPALLREVFTTEFQPLDLVFWAIATYEAFRLAQRVATPVTTIATDPTTAFSGQQAPWSAPAPSPAPGPASPAAPDDEPRG